MGLPIKFSVSGAIAGDDDTVAAAQTLAAPGNFDLDGSEVVDGVAIIAAEGQERAVTVTPAADETGNTFTIVGFNASGAPVSQTINADAANPVATTVLFQRVTRAAASVATAGDVEVGSAAAVYSGPVALNIHAQPVQISAGFVVTGTVNFDFEYTLDDVNAPDGIANAYWFTDSDIDGDTASILKTINTPIYFARMILNSGDGAVEGTLIQAGIVGG